jgi:hypothetical protein
MMSEEGKAALIARMLVVSYSLGNSNNVKPIPTTLDGMMSHGHDGLNWQKFLPLAKDILKTIGPDDTHPVEDCPETKRSDKQ